MCFRERVLLLLRSTSQSLSLSFVCLMLTSYSVVVKHLKYQGPCFPLWLQQGPSTGCTLSKDTKRGRVLLGHWRGRLQKKSSDSNSESWTMSMISLKMMPTSWPRGRLGQKWPSLLLNTVHSEGDTKRKRGTGKNGQNYWRYGLTVKTLAIKCICSQAYIRPRAQAYVKIKYQFTSSCSGCQFVMHQQPVCWNCSLRCTFYVVCFICIHKVK